jgi:hypothetical protein
MPKVQDTSTTTTKTFRGDDGTVYTAERLNDGPWTLHFFIDGPDIGSGLSEFSAGFSSRPKFCPKIRVELTLVKLEELSSILGALRG